MSRIVIALGGNALGKTPTEQKEAVKYTAKAVVDLVSKKNEVIICHGNGPQVGMINNAFMSAWKNKVVTESMPFAECGAMSQGYIGYHLQNVIDAELRNNNINQNVVSLITQTIVDKNDSAFKNPTKPVGPFYSEADAKDLAAKNNWDITEDSGRGWRRVVPSPKPIDIKEKAIINNLINDNVIVIAGGGGGIPVYEANNTLVGIDAVIDKDWTSAKLAELTKADALIILTAVPKVMINYGKPNQKALDEVSLSELDKHIADNQFAPGSMLPKIEAAINFVKSTNKNAYIGQLDEAIKIINGKSGTKVTK